MSGVNMPQQKKNSTAEYLQLGLQAAQLGRSNGGGGSGDSSTKTPEVEAPEVPEVPEPQQAAKPAPTTTSSPGAAPKLDAKAKTEARSRRMQYLQGMS
jgi:hypothetical protein